MPRIKKGTPRVSVSWGKDTFKDSSNPPKVVTVFVYSRVFESIQKLFNLPLGTSAGAGTTTKVIQTKKGPRTVLAGSAVQKGVSARYMFATTGSVDAEGKDQGKTIWHRIPVPPSLSLAQFHGVLAKGGKCVAVKNERGVVFPIVANKPSAEPGGKVKNGAG